jgi:hypothetical protein
MTADDLGDDLSLEDLARLRTFSIETLAALAAGLKSARAGAAPDAAARGQLPVYLGSFAQYADEDTHD